MLLRTLSVLFFALIGPTVLAQDPFLDESEPPLPAAPPSELDLEPVGYAAPNLIPEEAVQGSPGLGFPPDRGPAITAAFDLLHESRDGRVELDEYWGRVKIALPPVFGPPPPSLNLTAGMTDLDGIGLGELYTLSAGVNWIHPVNDRWTWMLGMTPGIQTDFENTSSDMWRVRANALAFYSPSPDLQWIFGAVVTGRSDLPVLPAIGLVVWPDDASKLELTFPRPRYSRRFSHHGEQEWWAYFGAELAGGTWAVERPSGLEDELTYRSYRLGVGLELVPPGGKLPGARPMGTSAYIEAGISLGRKLEYEHFPGEASLDEVFYFGGGVNF